MKKWLIGLILMVAGFVLAEEPATNAIERRVRYKIVLTNQRERTVPEAELRVRAPVKQTAHQRCVSVEASSPYELVAEPDGNQTLVFRFKEFPPFARTWIAVDAVLEMTAEPSAVPVDPAGCLGAAPMMELESPEFQRLAPRFGSGSPEQIARSAMNWIRNNVRDAGYMKRDHGALYALQEKRGDCTEQAFLFAALCRAHGVPARVLGGYPCTRDAVFGPLGYHLRAEFFDGVNWRPADPQSGETGGAGTDYVALCVVSETGLLTGTVKYSVSGDGLTAEME